MKIKDILDNTSVVDNGRIKRKKEFIGISCKKTKKAVEQQLKDAISQCESLNALMRLHNLRLPALNFIRGSPSDAPETAISPQVNITDKTQSQIDEEELELNKRIHRAKDITYMSDKQYQVFRDITQLSMPPIHAVKSLQKQLNREQLLPKSNEYGLYFDACDKIQLVLEKKLPNMTLEKPKIVRINIRADATLVGRDQKFMNICFNLPDEGKEI